MFQPSTEVSNDHKEDNEERKHEVKEDTKSAMGEKETEEVKGQEDEPSSSEVKQSTSHEQVGMADNLEQHVLDVDNSVEEDKGGRSEAEEVIQDEEEDNIADTDEEPFGLISFDSPEIQPKVNGDKGCIEALEKGEEMALMNGEEIELSQKQQEALREGENITYNWPKKPKKNPLFLSWVGAVKRRWQGREPTVWVTNAYTTNIMVAVTSLKPIRLLTSLAAQVSSTGGGVTLGTTVWERKPLLSPVFCTGSVEDRTAWFDLNRKEKFVYVSIFIGHGPNAVPFTTQKLGIGYQAVFKGKSNFQVFNHHGDELKTHTSPLGRRK